MNASRPDEREVWCVKHNTGWCATKVNRSWDDRSFNVPTACNFFVILPLEGQKRIPTCPECLDKLTRADDEGAA